MLQLDVAVRSGRTPGVWLDHDKVGIGGNDDFAFNLELETFFQLTPVTVTESLTETNSLFKFNFRFRLKQMRRTRMEQEKGAWNYGLRSLVETLMISRVLRNAAPWTRIGLARYTWNAITNHTQIKSQKQEQEEHITVKTNTPFCTIR